MIEADVDVYGSLSRGSALADFLEVAALRGISWNRAQIDDVISERYSRYKGILVDPDDDEDGRENLTDTAFECISERHRILGSLYPFEIVRSTLVLRQGFDVSSSPYVGILAITVSHAFMLPMTSDVKQLFEEVVTRAMASFGMVTGNFGQINRDNGNGFAQSIDQLSGTINIKMDSRKYTRHRAANDENVDVLAHIDWEDRRAARWVIIGQVTVGKSDSWEAKMVEPKTPHWADMMANMIEPLAFLAVPHHVERRTYVNLTSGAHRAILDRPRLAKRVPYDPLLFSEAIESMMASDIEDNLV